MKRILFTLCCGLMTMGLMAQDVHFSQFYASPLTLNPALTGKGICTFRAGVNYRNQWGSVVGPSSFQTYGLSFDAGILQGRLRDSKLGLGINFFNDRSGDGILTNMSAMGSLAYHQALGSDEHSLSFGFQAGLVQKRLDATKFVFEDMIDQNGVIPGATTADVLADDNFIYLDLNAGVHWNSNFSDNFHMYAGAAVFHITEPVETFKDDQNNVLNRKYVAHGGMKIGFNNKAVLLPALLYMNQAEGSNEEYLGGSSIGFRVGDESFFYVGGYYRGSSANSDAVVSSLGVDFRNLQLGLSYDINISDLNVASSYRGGLEVSLLYFGCIESTFKPKRVIDCPRF